MGLYGNLVHMDHQGEEAYRHVPDHADGQDRMPTSRVHVFGHFSGGAAIATRIVAFVRKLSRRKK